MKLLITLSLLIIFTSGCAVGPNYRRPAIDVPDAYRAPSLESAKPQDASKQTPLAAGSTTQATPAPAGQSFGDQKWWDVFQDPELQGLIRTALQNNYDVRIAATRILEAQAQLGITRADQLP